MKQLYTNPLLKVVALDCRQPIALVGSNELDAGNKVSDDAMETGASGFGGDFWN